MYDHNALISKVKSAYSEVYGVHSKEPYYQWSMNRLRVELQSLQKKLRFRAVDLNPSYGLSKKVYREWVPPIDIGYRNV